MPCCSCCDLSHVTRASRPVAVPEAVGSLTSAPTKLDLGTLAPTQNGAIVPYPIHVTSMTSNNTLTSVTFFSV